jgi:cell division transport system ATP-binding protein
LEATGWKDKEKINERIKEVLDNVHLENCESKMPYELSGGEQQRATIARALLNHPEIILADEPTGNLDPEKSERIIGLLKEINNKGTTIIVATHDYSIIKKFPSHTFVCENRSLVEINSENF